jgi:hypothetical protein
MPFANAEKAGDKKQWSILRAITDFVSCVYSIQCEDWTTQEEWMEGEGDSKSLDIVHLGAPLHFRRQPSSHVASELT